MLKHPFDSLMELDSVHIRLDCAALHLARDAYPQLDFGYYLSRLDELAEEVASRRPGLTAPLRYMAMRDVLVEQHGFRGAGKHPQQPDDSYMNRVLDRGLGLPISLSAVWLEVARRLKWPAMGIGFPGHFLVRFDDAERYLLIDPFNEGRTVSIEDCAALLTEQFGDEVKLADEHFPVLDTKGILARMLNNLRIHYLNTEGWTELERVLARLAAAEPDNPNHVQELAALHYRAGDAGLARERLTAFIRRQPDAEAVRRVRATLARLDAAIASLN